MFTKEVLSERFKYPFSDQTVHVANLAAEESAAFYHYYTATENKSTD